MHNACQLDITVLLALGLYERQTMAFKIRSTTNNVSCAFQSWFYWLF